MAFITFKNISIRGIASAVPHQKVKSDTLPCILTPEEKEKIIKSTGIRERRFAPPEICASDLCHAAAEKLLQEMKIDRTEIDLLIFLSQTSDYIMPSTSTILQHKLGLPKTTATFDINTGCAGYVYGLSTAFAYASLPGIRNVLLLTGDTLSKTLSPEDRTTYLLFGDAGSATLIAQSDGNAESFFSLKSDGAGENAIKITAGGARFPATADTLQMNELGDGSRRNKHHLAMDGVDVFNFTVREVPDDIRNILEYAKKKPEDTDYILFHQSNKYILDFFSRKLGFPSSKIPMSLEKYGNTSAASIPLTLVTSLKKEIENRDTRVLLSGYGAGLSWASAFMTLRNCHICELVEI